MSLVLAAKNEFETYRAGGKHLYVGEVRDHYECTVDVWQLMASVELGKYRGQQLERPEFHSSDISHRKRQMAKTSGVNVVPLVNHAFMGPYPCAIYENFNGEKIFAGNALQVAGELIKLDAEVNDYTGKMPEYIETVTEMNNRK